MRSDDGFHSSTSLTEDDLAWLEGVMELDAGALSGRIADTRFPLAILPGHPAATVAATEPRPAGLVHRRSVTGELLSWTEPPREVLMPAEEPASPMKKLLDEEEVGSPKSVATMDLEAAKFVL